MGASKGAKTSLVAGAQIVPMVAGVVSRSLSTITTQHTMS